MVFFAPWLSLGVALYFAANQTYAAIINYDFNITWVTANPDGQLDRPTIGINGQWPLPPITATVGDRVVVNVLNQLGNQTTSLHFHGLYMNGTNQMDGVVGVTQCGIPPGALFTYDFMVRIKPLTVMLQAHDVSRLSKLVLTGIILIWMVNIPMASEDR